ncbi:sensor histidine kinase [Spirosoma foliorum]|uniref:Sensor histidine kinase n=1 Tax=Spirosoma foliorum TaxID=2710596 RepID=A0A7G5H1I5_9BACT|nr:sensor histidine kinase [Spirosoma foliorum]QMW04977.1 sensor histidine kinase [Spirosoma foliorum]
MPVLPSQLALLTDETRYRGWTRIGFHGVLLVGVFLLIFSTYIPWFLYPNPSLHYPLKTYAGPILRDSLSVIVQYYSLVYLFTHYGRRPLWLLPGLVLYYLLLFTVYYYSSYMVKHYFGLADDYSGSINHFERLPYGQALVSVGTFFHLLFIIERAFYPLAVKLVLEVYRRQVRHRQLQQQYTRLELDFLKSQVHPHFLFNVLNSIYALTEEESPQAARITLQLAGMMRYALYETADSLVPLQKELNFIRDYMNLEQLRTLKRLALDSELPQSVDESLQIAPFLLITFIENAFKHGVQNNAQKSWVKLSLEISDDVLNLSLINSKPVNPSPVLGGLGLSNVKKKAVASVPRLPFIGLG